MRTTLSPIFLVISRYVQWETDILYFPSDFIATKERFLFHKYAWFGLVYKESTSRKYNILIH